MVAPLVRIFYSLASEKTLARQVYLFLFCSVFSLVFLLPDLATMGYCGPVENKGKQKRNLVR